MVRSPRRRKCSAGYYVLDCENLDQALEYAAKIPSAEFGSIEVRPLMSVPACDVTPAVMASTTDVGRAVEAVFRQEWSRIIGALVRVTHSLEIAEDAVQEAFAIAVQAWPSTGIPNRPAAWITTTARRRAIDRLRSASVVADDCAARGGAPEPRSARLPSPTRRSTRWLTTSSASSSSAATPRSRSRRKSR